MYTLAIVIGIYSYVIFFLGICGLLYKQYVIWGTVGYVLLVVVILCRNVGIYWINLLLSRKPLPTSPPLSSRQAPTSAPYQGKSKAQSPPDKGDLGGLRIASGLCLLTLFALQAIINLIGTLGPELAFDALWYHLTLPKIYLLYHKIFYIPGGLLYYSTMPKLTEMLYITAVSFGNETLAKLIHFSFGILTCYALYKLARKFFSPVVSLLAVVIFYSNLVVAWESITAYIDLTRTFFEVLSISAFINWFETKKKTWFILSAVLLGFAITTKILAIGSLGIFIGLIVFVGIKKRHETVYPLSLKLRRAGKTLPAVIFPAIYNSIVYSIIALAIPLPWFIFSYFNTGNFFYPFFTKTYTVNSSVSLLNSVTFFHSLWGVFTHSPDPLSPVYIAFVPLLVFVVYKSVFGRSTNWRTTPTLVYAYAFFSLIVWYITPNTGGGRFILPYLPMYSLLIASLFTYLFSRWFKKMLFAIVIFTACTSIAYREMANKKYLPVILGKETKAHFLMNNLNFSFGDFYDTDNYFATHVKPTDKVLLFGFHNLYYVDFPFIDSSYVQKGEKFNYIAVQHDTISKEFRNFHLIYQNKKTGVKLYTKNY